MTGLPTIPPPSETPTVLVVEDSPADLRLIREAFGETDGDCTVEAVTNGTDALEYLRRLHNRDPSLLPAFVLSDLHLPGPDGDSVVEDIRTELGLEDLPIIMLTHSTDGADVRRCYEARANAYLTKPDDFADLVSMISSVEDFWLDLDASSGVAVEAGHGRQPAG